MATDDQPQHGDKWLVSEQLELLPTVNKGSLPPGVIQIIQHQALERLAARDPILRHVLEVKVVCNQRRNFVNFSVRKEYMGMCHMDTFDSLKFCYFISDKLEPYVIVTAVHPQLGRLHQLSRQQVEQLAQSLTSFKQRFGITNESYHYTPLKERNETDTFVSSGIPPPGTKAHSSHFHLIRVATSMIVAHMPIYELLNISLMREVVEPVKYNFSRQTMSWDQVYQILLAETATQ